jgi:DNA-directed RNA polymerase subunit L
MLKQEDKVIIVIQAQDESNTLKTITNACEITMEQFKSMCDELEVL